MAALPVTLPLIGVVTVKPVNVPTLVNDELTTFDARVVPVKADASVTAVIVIFEVPSKDTPLIVLAFCKAVAVAAFPVTLPLIGAVTVKPVNVPTLVNDELTTLEASVVPVNAEASATAVIVIFDVPSKDTPLIVLAF